MVETLLPPLKGFQFNRTVFFSPFLWYGAFFMILQRMYAYSAEREGKGLLRRGSRLAANALALAAAAVILLMPSRYNDLFFTCKNKALELLKGKEADEMNFQEFYSCELFESIKQDIGYAGNGRQPTVFIRRYWSITGLPHWTAISVFIRKAIKKTSAGLLLLLWNGWRPAGFIMTTGGQGLSLFGNGSFRGEPV